MRDVCGFAFDSNISQSSRMVWFGLIGDKEVLGFFVFVFKGFMYFVVKILNSFVLKK